MKRHLFAVTLSLLLLAGTAAPTFGQQPTTAEPATEIIVLPTEASRVAFADWAASRNVEAFNDGAGAYTSDIGDFMVGMGDGMLNGSGLQIQAVLRLVAHAAFTIGYRAGQLQGTPMPVVTAPPPSPPAAPVVK